MKAIAEKTTHSKAILAVSDLHVYYGHIHVLQGVSFSLEHHGVLGIVGRNGMGKTTLCNAIMGLVRSGGGSVLLDGRELLGMQPYRIVDQGAGYVPQGRRLWPSLTVDEHLRVAARGSGPWDAASVYRVFPRLAERRQHEGNQLSGGEQQMLAIGRSLVANPKLLIMDEPTEGLAPQIVKQVEDLLIRLAREEDLAVLLVEQNLGVATKVARRLAVMVNGRIETELDSATLAADRALQQRLLGVSSEEEATVQEAPQPAAEASAPPTARRLPATSGLQPSGEGVATRWSHGNPLARGFLSEKVRTGITQQITRWGRVDNLSARRTLDLPTPGSKTGPAAASTVPKLDGVAYVVGTFDTKQRELMFVGNLIAAQNIRVKTVDLSTSGQPSMADVKPSDVAAHHPKGSGAVFTGDRGSAVTAMSEAFARFLDSRKDVGGVISLGGSGGTALATPGMQSLNVGVPKIMVSTMASGNVKPYVGASDICMLYSVTDVAGINRISERVLANAANALVGMMSGEKPKGVQHKPAIGLTMFGVTTPCVQAVVKKLEHKYDCLVFHATGTGGRSMEKLVDSGVLEGVIDITTSEVTDHLLGGVLSAGEDRMGAIIRTGVPYVGACGALEMINFGAPETVPERYQGRNIYRHNPQVTIVRITAEESKKIGEWIGNKLNQMQGQVRFFIPEGGMSLVETPGAVFHDAHADAALFEALERTVNQNERRRLERLPYDINNPAFADALVRAFNEIAVRH
ncbi:MAG: ABC transporter permease [Desulfobacterales bacterium]|nr:MAG: ABC transporter permease [Desulfobacterales bacterium]